MLLVRVVAVGDAVLVGWLPHNEQEGSSKRMTRRSRSLLYQVPIFLLGNHGKARGRVGIIWKYRILLFAIPLFL